MKQENAYRDNSLAKRVTMSIAAGIPNIRVAGIAGTIWHIYGECNTHLMTVIEEIPTNGQVRINTHLYSDSIRAKYKELLQQTRTVALLYGCNLWDLFEKESNHEA